MKENKNNKDIHNKGCDFSGILEAPSMKSELTRMSLKLTDFICICDNEGMVSYLQNARIEIENAIHEKEATDE